MIPIELLHGINHGNNVFNWSASLNIVNCVEHESASGREYFASPQNLFPDFGGCSEWQHFLRVNTSTPEDKLITESGLQLFGLHPRRRTLHGIEYVEPALDERRQKFGDRSA